MLNGRLGDNVATGPVKAANRLMSLYLPGEPEIRRMWPL